MNATCNKTPEGRRTLKSTVSHIYIESMLEIACTVAHLEHTCQRALLRKSIKSDLCLHET